MIKRPAGLSLLLIVAAGILPFNAGCGKKDETEARGANPVVIMETSAGAIKLELWSDRAPVTVENFLRYAEEGFYDDTIFHRVIADFMIQGGGFTADMREKPTHEPINNEAQAHLKNLRGTIAMARTGQIHSATSQFFINVRDNHDLDHKDNTRGGFGYAVFGKVIEGMDVVGKIRIVKTASFERFQNVPVTPIVIRSVRRVKP